MQGPRSEVVQRFLIALIQLCATFIPSDEILHKYCREEVDAFDNAPLMSRNEQFIYETCESNLILSEPTNANRGEHSWHQLFLLQFYRIRYFNMLTTGFHGTFPVLSTSNLFFVSLWRFSPTEQHHVNQFCVCGALNSI